MQKSDAWNGTLSSPQRRVSKVRTHSLRFIHLLIEYRLQAERNSLRYRQKRAERLEVTRESEPVSALKLDRCFADFDESLRRALSLDNPIGKYGMRNLAQRYCLRDGDRGKRPS